MARVDLGRLGSLDKARRKPVAPRARRTKESRRGYFRKRREAFRAMVAENRHNLGAWA